MPVKNILKIIWIISLIFFLTSCSKDNSSNSPDKLEKEFQFSVSGNLNNINNAQLSGNIRVVVFWCISAGSPDYLYVYGEGTFNTNDMTLEIVFENDPPADALNNNAYGVGVIALTTDMNLKEGILPGDYRFEDSIIGAAGQYGVIFIKDHEAAAYREWTDQFQKGYSIGKGVDVPEPQFDSFEPADPSSVEIIIDDPRNIEFVNWT